MRKRIFKTRVFSRWSRKILSDDVLRQAAREIEDGMFEADLGGGLCKKRIRMPGRGKSGSTRSLVAVRHKSAMFFLVGRQKNEPGSDFSDKEVDAAKILASAFGAVSESVLDHMKQDGVLVEITDGQE
jgi:hypothetical protein